MLYKGTKKEHKCWQHSCSKEILFTCNISTSVYSIDKIKSIIHEI